MTLDNKGEPDRIPRSLARAAALPRPFGWGLDWQALDWRGWLERCLSHEIAQRRLFPWLAVCFGLGIVLFFQADEPSLWAPLAALSICGAAAIRMRRRLFALSTCLALAAIFAGFSAGVIRTRNVAAPVLSRMIIAPVSGFIEAVEEREEGKRVLLRVTSLQGVGDGERPERVRASIRKAGDLAAGQFITGTARLLPPPQPAWPGGYDFARDAYYKGIGAVGSFTGAVRRIEPPTSPDWSLKLAAYVDEARNALTQRIASAIGGAAGGVGAALVTGKRGLIGEPTNDVLRSAGIYHIVSISGLHMVLAAGTFFWLVRALLALSPDLALRWPVKKIAAIAAMIGATAYCIFSGSDVATQRSLVMTLVMFGAILADRPALSMRNLSIAAILVLAREPEALLGPSFQMSFGAVAAMMTLVPLLQWRREEGAHATLIDKTMSWAGRSAFGLMTTTLVASLATAPFAAYHFQTLNPYGLIGNALALPLVSLVVMPAAVLGVLAYPFGLDAPVWMLMGVAVEKVLGVSAWVGGFSGSTIVVPALGMSALALLSLGLLVLTIPASPLRWLALFPAGVGLAFAVAPERYDIYVDRDGAGAAIRNERGELTLVGKPSGFVTEQWLRAGGDGRSADDASLKQAAQCDMQGCVVQTGARRVVAFVQEFSAFEEDCRRAAIVITRLDAPETCRAAVVLDRRRLTERGATAIRMGLEEFEIHSVKKGREVRPWTVRESASPANAAKSSAQERQRPARPVPEQDIPEDEISSGERD
ncbi:ComEC/Rec2 family competence protein [Microvirga guangxiensis]|uniref:Competence protein ComEC n=1 Tax=Microvirga guangxiensis TaxID=549386 RepID=A0A1G5J517_9HYPH|nr:ComEC/Rec2 family competence protein [Microvirga guangxiensis]SCY83264.1 competence protein ComEC [Microvirga guangxiensis]